MAKGKLEAAGLVGAGAAVTAIGGAYKLGEFLYKVKRMRDVGPSNAVYVRLIKRIQADLDEVKRLLTVPEVKDALEANHPKAKWVYGVMRDVRGALENITPHTERVASDVEDGRRIGVRHRLYWLLSEKEKLENREKELLVAHGSLTEVIGFLTPLEPVEPTQYKEKETRNTQVDIDVDVRHGGPDRVEEREVWVERHDRGPRHVHEKQETIIEHEGPSRHVEQETWVERDRDPRYVERETFVERRDPRHEERYYEDRQYGAQPGRVEEREFHYQRDPRHVEAEYYERGPQYREEKRYEERRFDRRPESFEDRVPDRETFMESNARRPYNRSPYGEYAEYGAPQPSGAAEYRRRFHGDPGFGDELVLNPQPVPPQGREYERETWIEEKEDYTHDQYGNKLPEQLQTTRYPQYPKPRY